MIPPRVPRAGPLKGGTRVPDTGGRDGASVRTPLDVLEASGVAYAVQEHVPILGQADVERELGLPVDRLLKTMVFCAGETVVLAALPVHGRVNYGRLARAVGVPRSALRQAAPEDLERIGMVPGGASPVCGVDGVVTVFDDSVARMGSVYCGSGRADRTVQIEAETLVDLVRPVIAPLVAQ